MWISPWILRTKLVSRPEGLVSKFHFPNFGAPLFVIQARKHSWKPFPVTRVCQRSLFSIKIWGKSNLSTRLLQRMDMPIPTNGQARWVFGHGRQNYYRNVVSSSTTWTKFAVQMHLLCTIHATTARQRHSFLQRNWKCKFNWNKGGKRWHRSSCASWPAIIRDSVSS